MTVGDRVMMVHQGPDEDRGYDTKCPLMGIVRAQDDPTTPTTADIIWDNGPLVVDIPIAMLLEVVANDEKEGLLIGKYLQINGLDLDGDLGLPKSPAASGICIQAFELTDGFQGGTAETAFAVIAIDDGRGCMLVPVAAFAALSEPATIAELEASGVISVRSSARNVASN